MSVVHKYLIGAALLALLLIAALALSYDSILGYLIEQEEPYVGEWSTTEVLDVPTFGYITEDGTEFTEIVGYRVINGNEIKNRIGQQGYKTVVVDIRSDPRGTYETYRFANVYCDLPWPFGKTQSGTIHERVLYEGDPEGDGPSHTIGDLLIATGGED